MPRTYLNFDLVITPKGEGYEARVVASPAGQAAAPFTSPFSELELENFRLRSGRGHTGVRRGDTAATDVARRVGSRLFSAAFEGAIGERLRESLRAVRATGAGLRLRVTGPPALGDLPWEYLYSPDAGQFLAVSTETPVVRYVAHPDPVPPLAITAPLRVLVVLASPADYPRIDAEREWASLSGAVAAVSRRGLVRFDRLKDASLSAVQRQLRHESYHIVHFIGHGAYDARGEEGVIILHGADGAGVPVSSARLGVVLRDHRTLRLVVLNTCESGRSAPGNHEGGIAQALVRARIPGVIAMQFEISNDAATTFAEEFYQALADGYGVDAALAEARKAIYAAGSGVEWGTQVLYTISPDGLLFSLDASGAREAPPAAATVLDCAGAAPMLPSVTRVRDANPERKAPAAPALRVPLQPEPAPPPVPGRATSAAPPSAPAATVPVSRGIARAKLGALLVLLAVFLVNLAETAMEGRWSSTVTARGLEFASALHWLEGGAAFENHDVTNVVAVYGFSLAYFFVFPALILTVMWALARHPDPSAFRTFAIAVAIDYGISLPFFLLFPVPERWAYPDASAILLSDLWDSRLIETFRPLSALDNCFPSFHTSMTVLLVLCCFVYRVGFRFTALPLGLMVIVSTYSLGVHWLADVAAGTFVGIISVAAAWRLGERHVSAGAVVPVVP